MPVFKEYDEYEFNNPVLEFVHSFEYKLRQINNQHYEIKNPLLRFIHTLLVQLPLNLLGMALEIVALPLAFIIGKVHYKQSDLIVHSQNATKSQQKINAFSQIKTRLALTLKLPVDLATSLIDEMIVFPFRVVKVLLENINSAYDFFKDYGADDSGRTSLLVRVPSTIASVVLAIITLPLVVLNPVLPDVLETLGVFSIIDKALTAIDTVATFAAAVAIEVPLLPITAALYINLSFNNLATTKQKIDEHFNLASNSSAEPKQGVAEEVRRDSTCALDQNATLLPSGGPAAVVAPKDAEKQQAANLKAQSHSPQRKSSLRA